MKGRERVRLAGAFALLAACAGLMACAVEPAPRSGVAPAPVKAAPAAPGALELLTVALGSTGAAPLIVACHPHAVGERFALFDDKGSVAIARVRDQTQPGMDGCEYYLVVDWVKAPERTAGPQVLALGPLDDGDTKVEAAPAAECTVPVWLNPAVWEAAECARHGDEVLMVTRGKGECPSSRLRFCTILWGRRDGKAWTPRDVYLGD